MPALCAYIQRLSPKIISEAIEAIEFDAQNGFVKAAAYNKHREETVRI